MCWRDGGDRSLAVGQFCRLLLGIQWCVVRSSQDGRFEEVDKHELLVPVMDWCFGHTGQLRCGRRVCCG